MTPTLLSPTLFDRLGKLARLFVWRRKSLHDEVVEELRTADARYGTLVRGHQDALTQLQALTREHGQLTGRLAVIGSELTQARQNYQALQQKLCEARTMLEEKSTALDASQQAFAQEQDARRKLAAELSALQQRHGDTWIRFQLISRLLAARPAENAGLARFRQLLANDYMIFAESESSLAAEAKALLMLQSIEQELSLLVGFPDMFKRTTVGIVGGFSSGKSEFLNSFILDREIRLAVGIQPVTAIPSYVLATDKRLIRGYSANGGHIDLDAEFYKNISHAFINSFSFNLKDLMPFMCVGVQMDPAYFSNICFIDTPGYNPPATAGRYSQSDKQTAVQFAQQSDAIIWLIGLDANGTVPDSDLEFIHEIGVEHRSVYVVLNKADLRPEDDLESIMDEVESLLAYESIPIAGISAYSSTQRRVIAHRGQSLMDHFAQINQQGDVRQHLEGRLNEVFDMYDVAIQSDIDTIRQRQRAINGLRLDALEIGGSDLYEKMQETLTKLDQKQDTTQLEKLLEESRRVFEAFTSAIQQTTEVLEDETVET